MTETITEQVVKPTIRDNLSNPAEQENEQLLKDLKTTTESFLELFSMTRPAPCHALEVVLDYCQKLHTTSFKTGDLTRRYGTQTVRLRIPGAGLTMAPYWAVDHRSRWERQRNNPGVFISNTYNSMTFMKQIIDLIATQNDPVKFPVTFQVQRSDNDKKKREPSTCKVVRNEKGY